MKHCFKKRWIGKTAGLFLALLLTAGSLESAVLAQETELPAQDLIDIALTETESPEETPVAEEEEISSEETEILSEEIETPEEAGVIEEPGTSGEIESLQEPAEKPESLPQEEESLLREQEPEIPEESSEETVTQPAIPEEPSGEMETQPEEIVSEPETISEIAEEELSEEPSSPEEESVSEEDLSLQETSVLSAVQITVSISDKGITLKWGKVSGATGYRVSRKEAGGSYKELSNTTKDTYTDSTAAGGHTYEYKIIAYAGDRESSSTVSCFFPGKPVLKKTESTSAGLLLTWSAISGVTGYQVYRKSGSSSYQLIGTTQEARYTDSTAVSGTLYSYAVAAYTRYGNCGYDAKGIKGVFLPEVNGAAAKNTKEGIVISWNAVSNASGYRIYWRNKGASSWKKLASTSRTEVTDKKCAAGKTREYLIRAYSKQEGTVYLGCKGKVFSCTRVGTVGKVRASSAYNGVLLKWSRAKGADSYKVYFRTGNESYQLLKKTSSLSAKHTNLTQGKVYEYTVVACYGTGDSGFADVSAKSVYLPGPSVTKVTAGTKNVKIGWAKVSGATGYRVYYREKGTSKWKAKNVTTNSFTKSCTSGQTFQFWVVPYVKVGQTRYYGTKYKQNIKTVQWFAMPTLSSVRATANGIRLNWTKVQGAESYTIYQKPAGGKWKKVGTSSTLEYTLANVPKGTLYYYAVAASSNYGEGKKSKSIQAVYLPGTTFTKLENIAAGVHMKWEAVQGAFGYRVYWRFPGETRWTKLKDVTSTAYLDGNVESGKTYEYLIIPYAKINGKKYLGYGPSSNSKKITWSVTDAEGLTAKQKALIQAAYNTEAAPSGYCASWVMNVLSQVGCSVSDLMALQPTPYCYAYVAGFVSEKESGFNGNDFWAYVCTSNDLNELKPGMIVATERTGTSLGALYGHVGIYVGNDTVLSSIGYIHETTVSGFRNMYGNTMRWGFAPNTY